MGFWDFVGLMVRVQELRHAKEEIGEGRINKKEQKKASARFRNTGRGKIGIAIRLIEE